MPLYICAEARITQSFGPLASKQVGALADTERTAANAGATAAEINVIDPPATMQGATVTGEAAVVTRPTPRASEIDVGADLPVGARPQVSFKDRWEVPYGTSGSVRPDWCISNVCSVEAKNHSITMNASRLVKNVPE